MEPEASVGPAPVALLRREEHGRVEEHELRRGRSRGPKHHHWVPVHVLRADPLGGRGGEGLGGSGVNDGDFSRVKLFPEAIFWKGRLSKPIGLDSFFLVGTASSYFVVSYTGKKLFGSVRKISFELFFLQKIAKINGKRAQ